MELFEGVPIGDINIIQILRDRNRLIVKVMLNGEVLIESFFWEFTNGILRKGDYPKLGRFKTLTEFVESLKRYLVEHGAKRVIFSSGVYDSEHGKEN